MKTKLMPWLKDSLSFIAVIILAMALGVQIPKWYAQWKGPFQRGDYSNHIKGQPYKLTLYGTTTCPHCKTAREFLKQEGIPFNDELIDQSKTAKEKFISLGVDAVPVIVSKDKALSGFNLDAYKKMVKPLKQE